MKRSPGAIAGWLNPPTPSIAASPRRPCQCNESGAVVLFRSSRRRVSPCLILKAGPGVAPSKAQTSLSRAGAGRSRAFAGAAVRVRSGGSAAAGAGGAGWARAALGRPATAVAAARPVSAARRVGGAGRSVASVMLIRIIGHWGEGERTHPCDRVSTAVRRLLQNRHFFAAWAARNAYSTGAQ